jgi:hypothetical protein
VNKTQLAVIGMSFVSVAALGAGLEDWSAALKPAFIFGAMGAVGSTIAAVYTEKPGQDALTEKVARRHASVEVLKDRMNRRVGKQINP